MLSVLPVFFMYSTQHEADCCHVIRHSRQKMADDFARLKAWRAQSGTEGRGTHRLSFGSA